MGISAHTLNCTKKDAHSSSVKKQCENVFHNTAPSLSSVTKPRAWLHAAIPIVKHGHANCYSFNKQHNIVVCVAALWCNCKKKNNIQPNVAVQKSVWWAFLLIQPPAQEIMRITVTSFPSITEKCALPDLYQVVQENHAYCCTCCKSDAECCTYTLKYYLRSTTKWRVLLLNYPPVQASHVHCCNIISHYYKKSVHCKSTFINTVMWRVT